MKRFIYLIFIFLLMPAMGCSSLMRKNVAPFERENLARQEMQLVSRPAEEIGKQHMFNAREGSVGGFGGGGGGCGCN